MSNPRVPGTRRLLQELLAAAAVAAAITAGLAGPSIVQGAPGPAALAAETAAPSDTPRARIRPVATRDYSDSLREPALVRSVNGVLTATLVVDTATLAVDTTVGAPIDTGSVNMVLRSFQLTSTTDPAYRSGLPLAPTFPGPTFRVRRGDLVRIQLINSLPGGGPQDANDACIQPQPDSVQFSTITIPDVFQACFHGPNYTNIHYHGMHVTPDSTSTMVGDDVLMAIAPGDTLQYSFRIPENQSPGTHWYHPHKHGSVAIQVANGMAGAFIVEDPASGLDSIVRVLGMREHLIAIQQVAERIGLLGHQGELDKSPVLANGQYQPTIYMAPGQRLDVFVRAPMEPGTHYFRAVHNGGASRRTRDSSLVPGQDLVPDVDLRAGTQPPGVVLFKVHVDPALSGNTTLPASLPPQPGFLSGELPAQRDTALIVFTDSLNQQPTQFYLGSRWNPFQRYDDHSVFVPSDTSGTAMPMVLNQTQTWKIVNNSQQLINHPFHIHINPFQVNQVVYPLGKDDPFSELYEQLNAAAAAGHPIWLDVLPLPLPDTTLATKGNGIPNTAYAVITQKYDDFDGCPNGSCGPPTGSFVMHCHILGHEERGMMQVLQVDSVAAPQGRTGGSHGAHQPGGQGSGGQAQPRQNPRPGHRH